MLTYATFCHMPKKKGKIVIPSKANIWPHELAAARALASYGHKVCFIVKSEKERENSADCWIDGEKWEIKSPRANHLKTIRKNIKEARMQSNNIIIDSYRMKKVSSEAILREITKQTHEIKYINKLKYIDKKRTIIDIKK